MIFISALRLFLSLLALTGLAYPLFITVIAQLAMKYEADGSLIYRDGKLIGSELLAQSFQSDGYFWPRPSFIDYNPLGPSGGSNLGPTSQKLKSAVEKSAAHLSEEATPDMVYASGSGLDPHISLHAAYLQIPRIANARNIKPSEIKAIVEDLKETNLRLFTRDYVNVLLLNLTLDEKFPRKNL